MAFIIRDTDNVRESFTSTGTTITAGGAITNSRALSAVLTNGDTFLGVARKGAEVSVGIFTWSTGGSIAQTTVFYSTNGNAAVSFSSGTGEIFMDAPSRLFDELNLKEITVAAAATSNIGAIHGAKILISGSGQTITSLGTSSSSIDKRRFVRFDGINTLTNNATSLILPGGANITTAAGDTAIFLQDASGNWRCYVYQRSASSPFDGAASASWVPTISSSGGSGLTSTLITASFKQIGKFVFYRVRATVTAIGTASGALTVTMPVTVSATNSGFAVGLNESTAAGIFGVVVFTTTNAVSLYASGGGFPVAAGQNFDISGWYEAT